MFKKRNKHVVEPQAKEKLLSLAEHQEVANFAYKKAIVDLGGLIKRIYYILPVFIVTILLLSYLAFRNPETIKVIVIETDDNGEVKVALAQELPIPEISNTMILGFLNEFIRTWRSEHRDPRYRQEQLKNLFYKMSAATRNQIDQIITTGNLYSKKIHSGENDFDYSKFQGSYVSSVTNVRITPISTEQTWQIQWNEILIDEAGLEIDNFIGYAVVQLEQFEHKDVDSAYKNPFGIRITYLSAERRENNETQ